MTTKINSHPRASKNGNADMDHEDELTRMVARLYGLECAIENSIERSDWGNGVHQLIQDIIEKMEKCAADFEGIRRQGDKATQQTVGLCSRCAEERQ